MKRPNKTFPLLMVVLMMMTAIGCTESSSDEKAGLPKWTVGQGWLYSVTYTYSSENSDGESDTNVEESFLEVRVSGTNVINGTGCYNVEEHQRKNGMVRQKEWFAIQKSSLNRMVGWDPQGPFDFPLKNGKAWDWAMDYSDYTIDMHSNCSRKKSIKTGAGTYDCYLVSYHGSHSEQDGEERSRRTFSGDLFYSSKVENVVLAMESEVYEYWNGDYYYKSVHTESRILETFGSGDSDGDGVCNKVEQWAGMDTKDVDTDSDGVADNEDCSPLMDLGFRLDLVRFTSDQDTDTSEGISGYECDPYLVLESYDLGLDETLGPYSDQNDVDLGFTKTSDLSEFTTRLYVHVDVWDDDSGELGDLDGDDLIDVSPAEYDEGGFIVFDFLENSWWCYPAKGDAGTEGSISGSDDGNSGFDGTLYFIMSPVDMGPGA